jgi:hypothetical protein
LLVLLLNGAAIDFEQSDKRETIDAVKKLS